MTRVTHVLHVPVIGQRTSYECGNTTLASLVQYFGRHYSPTELAQIAGTNKDGTDHAEMVKAAVATGATVFAKSSGSLKEVASFVSLGLPVIVGWWSMDAGEKDYDAKWTLKERKKYDCGHFSIICGTKASSFVFMDPQDGENDQTIGTCEKSDETFKRVWYDTDTDEFVRVTRWYMAINYDGRKFADVIAGGQDYGAARAKR
jgi:ABC-type bacteriocin/lantibiotic exporter with double-glycine peptidase domain